MSKLLFHYIETKQFDMVALIIFMKGFIRAPQLED